MHNITILENLQELLLYGGVYLNIGQRPLICDITQKLLHLQRLLLEIYPRNLDQIVDATPNLTSLAISTARRDKLMHLNALAKLTKLKELKIAAIGNKALEPFDKFSQLTTLTKLNLTGAEFNEVLNFGDLTLLADLGVLKLNQIKYDSMNGVMHKLTNLRRLDFLQHIHGSSSETLLDECEGLTRLTHLYIDDVYGKEAKILALSQLKSFAVLGMFNGIETMSHLRKLKLISMIQADAFHAVCSSMTALERLYLWSWLNWHIHDKDFEDITKLNNLTSLYIYGMDLVTNEGFGCVTKLTRLRRLDFAGELVTTDVLSELRQLTNLNFLLTATTTGVLILKPLIKIMNWRIEGQSLPSDIWGIIMTFLETTEIIRASQVDKISRDCRSFVRYIKYSRENWSLFAERMAPFRGITKLDILLVDVLAEFKHITMLQKLRHLHLFVADQTNVVPILAKLTSLQALELNIDENIDAIAENCTQITHLSLRSFFSSYRFRFASALPRFTQLQHLQLAIATRVDLADIPDLAIWSRLTSLVLSTFRTFHSPSYNHFESNLMRGQLSALTNLRVLEISNVAIKKDEAVYLQSFANLTNLERLELNRPPYPSYECVSNMPNLTCLITADNKSAENNYYKLESLTKLQALQLLVYQGLQSKLTLLPQTITKLHLIESGSPMNKSFVFEMVQHLPRLEDLSMERCKTLLPHPTVEDISPLTSLERLTSLNLHKYHSITSEEMTTIIKHFTNLKYLYLKGHQLSASKMLEVISMPSLKRIHLNGTLVKE